VSNALVFPRLEVLPPAQRRLWDELVDTPAGFVLHGGTAIALHLGHRASVDFDFFCWAPLDGRDLLASVPYLNGATVLEAAPNTLTVSVDRGGPVKLSFFGVPKLGRVRPPVTCGPVHLGSLLDLGGLKASVVQVRAEAKDYLDLHALLTVGGLSLPELLAAGQAIYGNAFSPVGALKALTFYGDGDLRSVSQPIRAALIEQARRTDPLKLPGLEAIDRSRGEP
jgi:hypothetical protein